MCPFIFSFLSPSLVETMGESRRKVSSGKVEAFMCRLKWNGEAVKTWRVCENIYIYIYGIDWNEGGMINEMDDGMRKRSMWILGNTACLRLIRQPFVPLHTQIFSLTLTSSPSFHALPILPTFYSFLSFFVTFNTQLPQLIPNLPLSPLLSFLYCILHLIVSTVLLHSTRD